MSRFWFWSIDFTDPFKLEEEELARSWSSLPFLSPYKVYFIEVWSSLALLCCFSHPSFQRLTGGISTLCYDSCYNKIKQKQTKLIVVMVWYSPFSLLNLTQYSIVSVLWTSLNNSPSMGTQSSHQSWFVILSSGYHLPVNMYWTLLIFLHNSSLQPPDYIPTYFANFLHIAGFYSKLHNCAFFTPFIPVFLLVWLGIFWTGTGVAEYPMALH